MYIYIYFNEIFFYICFNENFYQYAYVYVYIRRIYIYRERVSRYVYIASGMAAAGHVAS